MSFSLVVQKAIRARLTATVALTAVVPATNILDRNARPNPTPSIIMGEDQLLSAEGLARNRMTVASTLHIWKEEAGLEGVKTIADAVRNAIHSAKLSMDAGFMCGDCHVTSMRFLRDPDGETAHGIVMIETAVVEV